MPDSPRFELAPGYAVSRIINGCWQLTPDHGGGPPSEKETLAIMARLVEQGFTTFDCADIYEGTEERLGRFRRTLADPDSIQVHTKCVPNKATLGELTDAQIDTGIHRSLSRLGVERLDLVQLHWWDYEVPGLERLVERLLRAQSEGRIRFLGLTNFDTPHVRRIVGASESVISLQCQYSLLDRRPERQMTAYSAESGVRILAYGALAGGFLSHRYLGASPPGDMNRSLTKYRLIVEEAGGWDALQSLLSLLGQIADEHGTSIATVAGRWLLDRPSVGALILGIGHSARVEEKRALLDLVLDDDALRRLDAHLASQKVPPGDMYDLERNPSGPHSRIIRTNLQDAVP